MTAQEEHVIRYMSQEGDWLYCRDVTLLLDMIDAARAQCALIYENTSVSATQAAAATIGQELGLHLE